METLFNVSDKLSSRIARLIPIMTVVSLSSLFVLAGNLANSNNLIYIGIMMAFFSFAIKYILDLKEYIIILLFNLSIFIFLLGRYLIRAMNEIPMDVEPAYTTVSLNLVFISMIATNITYLLVRSKPYTQADENLKKEGRFDRLDLLTIVGLFISGACAAIKGFATYLYTTHHGYTSLYLSPDLPIPSYIAIIADILPFFVALYLARLPNKKASYMTLLSYCLLQLPLLLTGKRMPMMIALLVWIAYIVMRHYRMPNREQWIGRGEKIVLALLVPIVILIVPLIGDIRGGNTNQTQTNAIEELLDGQGVTLDVVSYGIKLQDETPPSIYGSYTFAPLLDYVSTNFLSRALFDTQEIQRQTEESATLGTSYSDTISHMVLWDSLYFSGQGLGSSYVIETYVDFGIVGLVLYSILLALLIRWMTDNFGRSLFRTFLILMLMMSVYALPRDTSLNFIVSSLQIQAILLIIGIYLYDKLMNSYKKGV